MAPSGIYPILYVFFEADGGLDREAFRRQVEACIAGGAHGIAILGLITEVAYLTPAERLTLIEWAAEDIAGRAPLAVTIAGTTPGDLIVLAQAAERVGADWLILQPPLGEQPTSAELLRFYGRVMEKVGLPVGIQNAPEFLGVGLEPEETRTLRRSHANFTVMKGEGPVVTVKRFLDALDGEVAIFNGRGGLELPDNLAAGCAGMIPAPDCADLQVRLFEAFQAGDEAAVEALYRRFLPYVVFAMQSIDVHVLYGKRLFAARAGIAGAERCRRVVTPAEPFFLDAMQRWSDDFGPYPGAAP